MKQQLIMSNVTKFPMSYVFETVEELENSTDEFIGLTLTNVMCSKYYNEQLPKPGQPLLFLSVENVKGAIEMMYSETIIEDNIDNLLERLIQKENYELCDVLVKWKQVYDTKFVNNK